MKMGKVKSQVFSFTLVMFIAIVISRNILVEIINLTICVFSTKRYIHEFTKRII